MSTRNGQDRPLRGKSGRLAYDRNPSRKARTDRVSATTQRTQNGSQRRAAATGRTIHFQGLLPNTSTDKTTMVVNPSHQGPSSIGERPPAWASYTVEANCWKRDGFRAGSGSTRRSVTGARRF